jgi:hypothetical protein
MTKNNSDKGKKSPDISGKKEKDEKKKKLNTFAYYLAWVAFFSALGSAFVKLIEKWEPPEKDGYYK